MTISYNVESIERDISNGYLTKRKHPKYPLYVINYTEKCSFLNEWNNTRILCRGLIVDENWHLVASGFPKFFNVGERGLAPTGDIAEVTTKVDGSLAIVFNYQGQWLLSTRGSFESEQAIAASEFLTKFQLEQVPRNYTLLAEWIGPSNRIVVNYPTHDLILLGIRDIYAGVDFFLPKVKSLGATVGFTTVSSCQISTVEEAVELSKQIDGQEEGWVLRETNGTRWKVKGLRYLELFKIIIHLTKKSVCEAMIHNDIDNFIASLPNECFNTALEWKKEIEVEYRKVLTEVCQFMDKAPSTSRKDFAIYLKDFKYRSICWSMYDEKDYTSAIYKYILDTV